MSTNRLEYRPDIDGIRAIAVLSVVFFHAHVELFSGGYVGVDVFFVISGYLITSILVKELAAGSFSITRFYERRFRRLLPALFVVVICTCAFGLVVLHPTDLVDLAQSAVATAMFSSNILFNLESGYFGGPAEFKPLLHTWSLAVEEQYYIVFPILLYLMFRYSRFGLKYWIAALLTASFVLCVYGTSVFPTASFYLLPTRAWELLGGSLIAVGAVPSATSRSVREALAACGIALVLSSLVILDRDTSFPGFAAALPVVGTMLLIHSGEGAGGKTFVARMLGTRFLVFIGLISYSLYLWHWPILVYGNYVLLDGLGVLQTCIALALVFLVAVVSWKYVEIPFRKKTFLATRASLLTSSVLASISMAALGAAAIYGNGYPDRYSFASSVSTEESSTWERWGACEGDMTNRLSAMSGLCRIGSDSGDPDFLLWGDSHARAMASAVDESARESGVGGVVATKAGCPPLLGIRRVGESSCSEFNDEVIELLKSDHRIEKVVLIGRWNLVTNEEWYKNEPGDIVAFEDVRSDPHSGEESGGQLLSDGLRRTLDELRDNDISVVLVNQIPEIGYQVPRVDFLASLRGEDLNDLISPSREEFAERSSVSHEVLASVAADYDVEALDPADYLCTERICLVSSENVTLYLDDDHLSVAGARHISHLFDSVFQR